MLQVHPILQPTVSPFKSVEHEGPLLSPPTSISAKGFACAFLAGSRSADSAAASARAAGADALAAATGLGVELLAVGRRTRSDPPRPGTGGATACAGVAGASAASDGGGDGADASGRGGGRGGDLSPRSAAAAGGLHVDVFDASSWPGKTNNTLAAPHTPTVASRSSTCGDTKCVGRVRMLQAAIHVTSPGR